MPAKSKKQQMAAGAALSAKRGEMPKKSLKGASKQMVESMSEKQLEEFAATERKKLPTKKESATTKAKSRAKTPAKTRTGTRKPAAKSSGAVKKTKKR